MEGVWHFRWYVTSILNVEMLNPKLCSGLQWWKLWFWRWCPFLKKQDQAGKLKELTAGTHFTLWYIMLYTFFVPAFFNKLLLMLCWRAYCIYIALVSCVGLPPPPLWYRTNWNLLLMYLNYSPNSFSEVRLSLLSVSTRLLVVKITQQGLELLLEAFNWKVLIAVWSE